MTMAEVKIKQWGNSVGVIIPKDIAKHEDLHRGDTIKLDIVKQKRIDGFGILKGFPKFKEDPIDHEV